MYMSRYQLAVCQKFNPEIHGYNPITSSTNIKEHYICLFTIDTIPVWLYQSALSELNYSRYGATIEIVETRMLERGEETVAIYKTFWLRIFQRRWRKWVIQRRFTRSSRLYSYLLNREYHSLNITL